MRRTTARLVSPLVAAALAGLVLSWPLVTLVVRGSRVAAGSAGPYVRRVSHAERRLLVVGDSSAVGIGASEPRHSVAGRLAEAHPTWSVGNLAVNGERTADVATLLERLARRVRAAHAPEPPYDALIVHTGGNDALRHTPSRALRAAIARVTCASSLLARRTVIVTGGNLALAPGLSRPWAWWFGHQSRRVRRIFRDVIPGSRVVYVDLYREPGRDPTEGDAKRFFAADGLHPSDDNYALWHQHIETALLPLDAADRGAHTRTETTT